MNRDLILLLDSGCFGPFYFVYLIFCSLGVQEKGTLGIFTMIYQ